MAFDGVPLCSATVELSSLTQWPRRRRRAHADAATNVLICVNIGCFALQSFLPLLAVGQRSTYAILRRGEWWRLATPMFLHSNLEHLLSNLCALYNHGCHVEEGHGWWRTVLVYVLSGIGGNFLAAYMEGPASNIVAVGASGAICGLEAARVVDAVRHLGARPEEVLRDIVIREVLNKRLGNIDVHGHVGGYLTGFFAGVAFGRRLVLERDAKGGLRVVDRPLLGFLLLS